MAAWQGGPGSRQRSAPAAGRASAPAPANVPAPGARPRAPRLRAHPSPMLLRQSRDEGAAPVAPHERTSPIPRDQEASTSSETSEPAEHADLADQSQAARGDAGCVDCGRSSRRAALPADEAARSSSAARRTPARRRTSTVAPSAAASGDARADGWLCTKPWPPNTPSPRRPSAPMAGAVALPPTSVPRPLTDANAKSRADLARHELGHTAWPGRRGAAASAPTRTMHGSLRAPPQAASTPIRARARRHYRPLAPKRPARARPGRIVQGAEARIDAGAGACRRHASPTGAAPAAARAPTELTLATPIDCARLRRRASASR